MKIKSILLSLSILAFSCVATAQTVEVKNTVKPVENHFQDFTVSQVQNVKLATVVQVNPITIEKWYVSEPEQIRLSIPGLPEVVLHKVSIHENFSIRTDKGEVFRGKQYQGIHYQSRVSVAALSVFDGQIMAVVSANNTQYNLGPDPQNPRRYLLVKEKDLPPNPFICHVQDDHPDQNRSKNQNEGAEKSALSVSCKQVRIGFTADFALHSAKGGVQGTANYLSGLFNVVKLLYRNERIAITFGSLFVYTTPDPWANINSSFTILYQFSEQNTNNHGSNHLSHFVCSRPAFLGGIAWLNSLCNIPELRFGFSNIYNTFSQLPVYSWSVYVLAHELGHNFGSQHTHWCGWQRPDGTVGPLDSCYSGEGQCNAITKPMVGTIMSYCHITAGGIDFTRGFGLVPGNTIRQKLADASCIPTISSPQCDSLGVPPPPPPPPPAGQCVSNLLHYTNAAGQSCFSFSIRPGCRYTLNYCRYDGFSQSNPPQPGAIPSACSVRNGLNNYLPTPAQLAAGRIDLVANQQPFIRQRWYALRCAGSDGITQLHFFWWP